MSLCRHYEGYFEIIWTVLDRQQLQLHQNTLEEKHTKSGKLHAGRAASVLFGIDAANFLDCDDVERESCVIYILIKPFNESLRYQ